MASQISDILDAIAGITVNSVEGRTLAQAGKSVSQTPVRIISPLSDKNEARGAVRATLGGMVQVSWVITDLMLFKATKDGSGLEYNMAQLVSYLGAYVETLHASKKLGLTNGVMIEDIDIEIGTFQYPLFSDNFYHGAKATLTIHETIT